MSAETDGLMPPAAAALDQTGVAAAPAAAAATAACGTTVGHTQDRLTIKAGWLQIRGEDPNSVRFKKRWFVLRRREPPPAAAGGTCDLLYYTSDEPTAAAADTITLAEGEFSARLGQPEERQPKTGEPAQHIVLAVGGKQAGAAPRRELILAASMLADDPAADLTGWLAALRSLAAPDAPSRSHTSGPEQVVLQLQLEPEPESEALQRGGGGRGGWPRFLLGSTLSSLSAVEVEVFDELPVAERAFEETRLKACVLFRQARRPHG